MFALSPEPPAFSEAGLQCLLVSVNRPVMERADLPRGTARAAILVFAEEYGGLGVAVGLRCGGGNRVAFFRYQAQVDRPLEAEEALQTGLAFAKNLGFAFDEGNPMGRGGATGRADALRRWHALVGEAGVAEREGPSPRPARPPARSAQELLLENALEEAPPASKANADAGVGAPRARSATGPTTPPNPAGRARASRAPQPTPGAPSIDAAEVSLTKFREDGPQTPSPANSGSGSALGRIPLVRRRAEKGRAGLLARLLGSF